MWRYMCSVKQTDFVITEEFMLRLRVKNWVLYKTSELIGKVSYKPMSL